MSDAADPSWRCWTGCPTSNPDCRFWRLCRPIAPEPEPKESDQ